MEDILIHNNWDPLEEIWLGDVWPSHFYDDVSDSRVRDSFYQITEWTKQDLKRVENKLKEFNVLVRRPKTDGSRDLYLDTNLNHISYGKLLKPPITPRDNNAVIGNRLYFNDYRLINCYRDLLNQYNIENVTVAGIPNTKNISLSGAGTVRLGRDIIFDLHICNDEILEKATEQEYKSLLFSHFYGYFKPILSEFQNDYRIHLGTNGGHVDGCFMTIGEGKVICTHYWDDYDLMFPGWEKFHLYSPTYSEHSRGQGPSNNRWTVPGYMCHQSFNEYIEKYCTEWVGNYKETFFEVNVMMIDEKNMLCMGEHESLFNDLEKHGISCHVVPFRTRTFWDGGLHCITLDIKRRATMKDYFPDRGDNGLKTILNEKFSDINMFLKEYEKWEADRGNQISNHDIIKNILERA